MNNLKKAIALVLSIMVILAFTTFSNATQIMGNNTSAANNSSNSENEPANTAKNNTNNNLAINNTAKQINTSNSTQNLPNTGLDSTEINFALILLLTLVFGMFSLVQYNKIVKKDE